MVKILDRQCRDCPEASYIKQNVSANTFYKCPYTNKTNLGDYDCTVTKDEYNKKHNIICNQCYHANHSIVAVIPPIKNIECGINIPKHINECSPACDNFMPLYEEMHYPSIKIDDIEDISHMPLNSLNCDSPNTIPSDCINEGNTGGIITVSTSGDVYYEEPYWTSDNRCSRCKTYALTYSVNGSTHFYLTKYCPNCGAKLKEKTKI